MLRALLKLSEKCGVHSPHMQRTEAEHIRPPMERQIGEQGSSIFFSEV